MAINWGDVPTWVGAILTGVAAIGIFKIANDERDERLRLRKEAEWRAASGLIHDFTDAVMMLYFARHWSQEVRAGRVAALPTARWIHHGVETLRLLESSQNREVTALPVDVAENVMLTEAAWRTARDA